jgi:hypothetical protein
MKNKFIVHFVETKKNDKLLSLGRAENIPWPSQIMKSISKNLNFIIYCYFAVTRLEIEIHYISTLFNCQSVTPRFVSQFLILWV